MQKWIFYTLNMKNQFIHVYIISIELLFNFELIILHILSFFFTKKKRIF